MNDIKITNWSELNDALYQDSYDTRLNRHRSPFAFRGLCRPFEELKTSLMTLGEAYCDLEGHLLRNFKKYAHRDAVAHDSVWNWLSLAQHHGLPTRMLDWTYSPYVALHFVTHALEHFHEDGIVWCMNYVRAKEHLPAELCDVLKGEGSDVFTGEMLHQAARSLEDLENLSSEPFVVFLEPPSLDDRIVNQSALFSLMSRADVRLDEWLEKRPDIARRIIIPADLKWEIRDKLDQANITERVLFPGLDGLSRWLRRYYSPRR